jgi:hypothetical protein
MTLGKFMLHALILLVKFFNSFHFSAGKETSHHVITTLDIACFARQHTPLLTKRAAQRPVVYGTQSGHYPRIIFNLVYVPPSREKNTLRKGFSHRSLLLHITPLAHSQIAS